MGKEVRVDQGNGGASVQQGACCPALDPHVNAAAGRSTWGGGYEGVNQGMGAWFDGEKGGLARDVPLYTGPAAFPDVETLRAELGTGHCRCMWPF